MMYEYYEDRFEEILENYMNTEKIQFYYVDFDDVEKLIIDEFGENIVKEKVYLEWLKSTIESI